VLEEAAEGSHLSVSAFVLQAAELRADEILLEREMVRLASDAARAFATALERPPKRSTSASPGRLIPGVTDVISSTAAFLRSTSGSAATSGLHHWRVEVGAVAAPALHCAGYGIDPVAHVVHVVSQPGT
jgi:hypothetical protein